MTQKNDDLMSVIEAILFMYGKDVSYARIAQLTDASEEDIRKVVQTMQDAYEERSSGLRIITTDDAVQMVTHPSVALVIEQMTKKEIEGPLTPVAMEVLSIIAYRGPISKIDIEAIRGVNCSFTLRNLLRRGLIERVEMDADKRTHHYRVSMDFLRSLGVGSVDELPEFKELSTDKRIDAILYNEENSNETFEQ
jgi:segregation and condensation protein B